MAFKTQMTTRRRSGSVLREPASLMQGLQELPKTANSSWKANCYSDYNRVENTLVWNFRITIHWKRPRTKQNLTVFLINKTFLHQTKCHHILEWSKFSLSWNLPKTGKPWFYDENYMELLVTFWKNCLTTITMMTNATPTSQSCDGMSDSIASLERSW